MFCCSHADRNPFTPQASPLVAGLAVAGAAFVAKQAVQTYIKLSASGSLFSGSRAFYKVGTGIAEVLQSERERFKGRGVKCEL